MPHSRPPEADRRRGARPHRDTSAGIADPRSARVRPVLTVLLAPILALVLATTPVVAAEPEQGATPAAGSEKPKKEPVCVHGCQRWGKLCNVDPRGVYKCRRTCEKFGEICE